MPNEFERRKGRGRSCSSRTTKATEKEITMAKSQRGVFEGLRSHGTDVGGNGYIHPRSDKYRENFDNIKWDKPTECDCKGNCGGAGGKCCKGD